MRYLLSIFFLFFCLSAFSQGTVDRIELGYGTTKRGIVWVRPGLPTHEPVWRISRDTNSILWHNLTTGIRYDWSYESETWHRKDVISQTLPPLETLTSGLATIDNTTADWINDDGISHFYDNSQSAWIPHGMSYQSAAPSNVAADVGNAAAIYTTTLWQDSDDFTVHYWDGDSWEILGPFTEVDGSITNEGILGVGAGSGTSSTITTNTSTGNPVTINAAGILAITESTSANGGSITLTATEVDGSTTNELQTLANTSNSTAHTATLSNSGGSLQLAEGANITLTTTGTTADGIVTIAGNAGTVTSVGLALPTSVFDISGSPVTSSGTLTGTFDNQSANTVFAGPTTGAAATPAFRALVAADIPALLSGAANQLPYFNTTTTITTESGSGANSIYWNATTNKMSIGSTGGAGVLNIEYPGGFTFDRALEFTNSGGWTNRWIEMYAAATGSRGFSFGGQNNVGADVDNVLVVSPWPSGRVAINKDPSVDALNYSFELAGVTNTDGLVISRSGSPTDAAMWNMNSSGDGILRTKSGFWTLGDLDVVIGSQDPSAILHLFGPTGASTDPIFRMEKTGGFGTGLFELGYSGGEKFIHLSNGTTRAITVESNNPETIVQIGINQTAPAQTLHVQGTARITGSDGTATTVMGRDGDGDISALSLSGMSISAGTLTATDGSTTNELQTLAHTSNSTSHTATLSNSGGSLQIIEGSGLLLTTGGTGLNGTVTIEAIDPSTTNEIQTLSASGAGPTSYNIDLTSSGTSVTLSEGSGIDLTRSGNTITVASTAASAWILDGNTITSAKRIGSNDNFDVVVETNGTDRVWFDNGGTVSIGATQLTTAALNINGLQGGIGQLIAGGSGLVAPSFYQATGSGSGSTATVFSGVVSMLNGNVEALIQNSSTSGTGGALLTLNTDESATGDPKVVYTTAGTTDWAHGIDNSASGEPWRLTDNSDIGSGTSTITANTSNQVGINQNTPLVQLHVTGTDGIGIPTGTTAQRSAAAIPQIRHNNTFSGLEFYDHNKGYYYRLTAVSIPTVASNAAAGTGHSANVLAGELSSDVRGVIELNTGSASMAVGTVVTVTYASAYSGTKTVVLLDAGNDIAATQKARYRVDTQSNTGFTIRAVTALDINETYVFKYYVGQ